MACVAPFVGSEGAFPCGKCGPCLSRRRRLWFHRLVLEAACHEASSFVTLTYDDDNLPADGSVDPLVLRNWLKRFRKRLAPRKVRYFAIGEYGDRFGRPHYHAALFGYASCQGSSFLKGVCSCPSCSNVREAWNFGHVLVRPLEKERAMYLCGYLTKQWTSSSQPLLRGRAPEFSRMSLKPGLGALAMHDVASSMLRYDLQKTGVPVVLAHGRQSYPLGRYLREQLRVLVDVPKDESWREKSAADLSAVRSFAWSNNRSIASVYAELHESYASTLAQRASLAKKRVL